MTRLAGFLSAFWAALALTGTPPAMAAVQPGLNSSGTPDLDWGIRPELAASTRHGEEIQPPPPSDVEDLTEPDPTQPTDGETPPEDEVSIGEIPVVQMVELTPETAQRAVDVYVIVKDKYKDAALENFDSLQDFVDRDPLGKTFEADIKAAGFANVTEWNLAITTVGAAYSNIIDDQSTDIKQQIEEVEKDTELAQDMKDRIITSLNALIPSENNHKVVQGMIDNPVYSEKLKLLETEEE
ncbi:MAG: hypothetical protein ABI705_05005 [Aestuariivirga sp.]